MRARLLALLDDRERYVAEALGGLGVLLEELAEPDGAGEPGRSGPDDEDADLDPLVGRVGRLGDELARPERRRKVGRARHHRPCALRRSSMSFGTMVCTSPTTARSLNSKIGAFGSLLMATIDLGVLHSDLVLHRARDAQGDVETSARPSCPSGRSGPSAGTTRRRRRRGSRRRHRRAWRRVPRRARSARPPRAPCRRQRSPRRPRSTGPRSPAAVADQRRRRECACARR